MKFLKNKVTIGFLTLFLLFGLMAISKPQIRAQTVQSPVAITAPELAVQMVADEPVPKPQWTWKKAATAMAKEAAKAAAGAAAGFVLNWLIQYNSPSEKDYPKTALDF